MWNLTLLVLFPRHCRLQSPKMQKKYYFVVLTVVIFDLGGDREAVVGGDKYRKSCSYLKSCSLAVDLFSSLISNSCQEISLQTIHVSFSGDSRENKHTHIHYDNVAYTKSLMISHALFHTFPK